MPYKAKVNQSKKQDQTNGIDGLCQKLKYPKEKQVELYNDKENSLDDKSLSQLGQAKGGKPRK